MIDFENLIWQRNGRWLSIAHWIVLRSGSSDFSRQCHQWNLTWVKHLSQMRIMCVIQETLMDWIIICPGWHQVCMLSHDNVNAKRTTMTWWRGAQCWKPSKKQVKCILQIKIKMRWCSKGEISRSAHWNLTIVGSIQSQLRAPPDGWTDHAWK